MPIRFARPRGPALWWFDLDHDATVELFSYDRRDVKTYGLLHENGSLMFDANGPLHTDTWDRAVEMARTNSTNWIAFFHEHRVVHIAFADYAFVEGEVLTVPHPDARDTLARLNEGTTPDEETERRTQVRKRASGAQNRKARRRTRARGGV